MMLKVWRIREGTPMYEDLKRLAELSSQLEEEGGDLSRSLPYAEQLLKVQSATLRMERGTRRKTVAGAVVNTFVLIMALAYDLAWVASMLAGVWTMLTFAMGRIFERVNLRIGLQEKQVAELDEHVRILRIEQQAA